MIPDPFLPPSPEPTQPESASARMPDPMAVHRDPSKKRVASSGTIAARARVYGNYEWMRIGDLSAHAAQSAVGKGISLERALMHTVYRAPARAVSALRQQRAVARERGTIPPAPATPSPDEGVAL